jgi:hypothetical protein
MICFHGTDANTGKLRPNVPEPMGSQFLYRCKQLPICGKPVNLQLLTPPMEPPFHTPPDLPDFPGPVAEVFQVGAVGALDPIPCMGYPQHPHPIKRGVATVGANHPLPSSLETGVGWVRHGFDASLDAAPEGLDRVSHAQNPTTTGIHGRICEAAGWGLYQVLRPVFKLQTRESDHSKRGQ